MDAASHLRAARRSLVAQRDEFDKAIKAIDQAIGAMPSDNSPLAELESPASEGRSVPEPGVDVGEARPTIRQVLNTSMPRDVPMHFKDIMGLLESQGIEPNQHSVRGVLHKFVGKGYLLKGPRPATFVLPSPNGEQGTLEPALAGGAS